MKSWLFVQEREKNVQDSKTRAGRGVWERQVGENPGVYLQVREVFCSVCASAESRHLQSLKTFLFFSLTASFVLPLRVTAEQQQRNVAREPGLVCFLSASPGCLTPVASV